MSNPYPARREGDALYPYFPPRPSQGRWHGLAEDGMLPEVHLYDGSRCNRTCAFCCVGGNPRGWFKPYCDEALDMALSVVSPTGKIKFFGGEPSMAPDNVIAAMTRLRAKGFRGAFRVYSNGIEADNLLRILDHEPHCDAVLNYSILHGRGVKPIPEASLAKLLAYPAGRVFSGHAEIEDTGTPHRAPEPSIDAPNFKGQCPHCHPAMRSDGVLHGCPFAVEIMKPPFLLNEGTSDGRTLIKRYLALVAWQKDVVETEAARRGITPCQVCQHHLDELPPPARVEG